MLTDGEVRSLIERKKITIEPFNPNHLKAGKYNVHLGRYLLVPENKGTKIDPRNFQDQPQYKKNDLTEKPFVLKPGQFVLGQTAETIGLDSDVGMFIDGRTTIARLGVLIHLSATFINPGQDPHIITLEIYNAGPWKIVLSENLQIGRLIMFKYSKKNLIAAKTYNRYNGQKTATGAIFVLSDVH